MHCLFRGADIVSSGRGGEGGSCCQVSQSTYCFFFKSLIGALDGSLLPRGNGVVEGCGWNLLCSCLDLCSISEKGLLSRLYIFAFSNACLGWFPGGC